MKPSVYLCCESFLGFLQAVLGDWHFSTYLYLFLINRLRHFRQNLFAGWRMLTKICIFSFEDHYQSMSVALRKNKQLITTSSSYFLKKLTCLSVTSFVFKTAYNTTMFLLLKKHVLRLTCDPSIEIVFYLFFYFKNFKKQNSNEHIASSYLVFLKNLS